MEVLELAAGFQEFTFPDKPEFGKYRGKRLTISYGFDKKTGTRVRELGSSGPELEGKAREFVLTQLAPIRRYERE